MNRRNVRPLFIAGACEGLHGEPAFERYGRRFFPASDRSDSWRHDSNLKLRKIVYYAQAWHLALRGKPLFGEEIEAWAHGPVVPELYRRFKRFAWGAIDPLSTRTEPYDTLHKDDIELLDEVWAKYGRLTAKQLERLTHAEAPWKDAYGETRPGARCAEVITHRAMREFYGKRLKQAASPDFSNLHS